MLCKAYPDKCKLLKQRTWGCLSPRIAIQKKNLRLSTAAWCASTVRGYVIAFHSPMNWTFSFAITQTVADGKWSHQHATPITPELSWCILRRGVAIIGPNGNRCCVPWDMASLAQRAGCQALGSWETSCCFSSPHSLHIRNNLLGTMSEITSLLTNWGKVQSERGSSNVSQWHTQIHARISCAFFCFSALHMREHTKKETNCLSL